MGRRVVRDRDADKYVRDQAAGGQAGQKGYVGRRGLDGFNAVGAGLGTADCRSDYGLDAERIAARVQGLLHVRKAILAGDEIVETDTPRGGEGNRGRPRVGVAEGAGYE